MSGAAGGKVVVVTGSSSGMGRATVELLTDQGHTVIGGDLAPQGDALKLDVRSDEQVREFVAAAASRVGRIDALVNAAGYALGGAIEEATVDEARALFDTNLFGAVRLIKAVLPIMRRQGAGTIINISSGAAQVAEPFAGHYSASKFAIEGLTEALRMEVRPFGVHAVLVVPGWTRTNIIGHSKYPTQAMPEYADARARIEPLVKGFVGAAPPPENVAHVIARIVTTRKPRLRYRVGSDVIGSFWTKRFLPASLYERLVRSYYKLMDRPPTRPALPGRDPQKA